MTGDAKTEAELDALRAKLMAMSLDEAERFYRTAYQCCELVTKVPDR